MEGIKSNSVSEITETTPRIQAQQPKTVTFCCNILEPKGQNLTAQDNTSTRSEEDHANVKVQRNRLRSAQRAYEQEGYLRLRELVPSLRLRRKKPSRLETLKHTCAYITHLKDVLEKLQAIKAEKETTQKREEVKNMDGMIIHEVKK